MEQIQNTPLSEIENQELIDMKMDALSEMDTIRKNPQLKNNDEINTKILEYLKKNIQELSSEKSEIMKTFVVFLKEELIKIIEVKKVKKFIFLQKELLDNIPSLDINGEKLLQILEKIFPNIPLAPEMEEKYKKYLKNYFESEKQWGNFTTLANALKEESIKKESKGGFSKKEINTLRNKQPIDIEISTFSEITEKFLLELFEKYPNLIKKSIIKILKEEGVNFGDASSFQETLFAAEIKKYLLNPTSLESLALILNKKLAYIAPLENPTFRTILEKEIKYKELNPSRIIKKLVNFSIGDKQVTHYSQQRAVKLLTQYLQLNKEEQNFETFSAELEKEIKNLSKSKQEKKELFTMNRLILEIPKIEKTPRDKGEIEHIFLFLKEHSIFSILNSINNENIAKSTISKDSKGTPFLKVFFKNNDILVLTKKGNYLQSNKKYYHLKDKTLIKNNQLTHYKPQEIIDILTVRNKTPDKHFNNPTIKEKKISPYKILTSDFPELKLKQNHSTPVSETQVLRLKKILSDNNFPELLKQHILKTGDIKTSDAFFLSPQNIFLKITMKIVSPHKDPDILIVTKEGYTITRGEKHLTSTNYEDFKPIVPKKFFTSKEITITLIQKEYLQREKLEREKLEREKKNLQLLMPKLIKPQINKNQEIEVWKLIEKNDFKGIIKIFHQDEIEKHTILIRNLSSHSITTFFKDGYSLTLTTKGYYLQKNRMFLNFENETLKKSGKATFYSPQKIKEILRKIRTKNIEKTKTPEVKILQLNKIEQRLHYLFNRKTTPTIDMIYQILKLLGSYSEKEFTNLSKNNFNEKLKKFIYIGNYSPDKIRNFYELIKKDTL